MNKILLFTIVFILGFFILIESEWLGSKNVDGGLFPNMDYKPSISQGESSYQSACIKCHGDNLLGSEQGPSLLDEIYKPSHHADLSFYYAVKSGVRQHHWKFGDMPKIDGLSPERVSDIISYVRHKQFFLRTLLTS